MKTLILTLASGIIALCLAATTLNSCTDLNADNNLVNNGDSTSGGGTTEPDDDEDENKDDNDNSELFIDGMYFSRNGFVNSPIKTETSDAMTTTYYYDKDGRISKTEQISYGDVVNTTVTYSYEYSYKRIIRTWSISQDYKDSNLRDTTVSGITTIEYY